MGEFVEHQEKKRIVKWLTAASGQAHKEKKSLPDTNSLTTSNCFGYKQS